MGSAQFESALPRCNVSCTNVPRAIICYNLISFQSNMLYVFSFLNLISFSGGLLIAKPRMEIEQVTSIPGLYLAQ
jgi:hypothetical protein